MPVQNINRYTCPVTGGVEYGYELPHGWFTINNEVFGYDSAPLVAQWILDHPNLQIGTPEGFAQMMSDLQPAA